MAIAAAKRQPARSDPRPRSHDGAANWTKLRDRDPEKHYVYVSLGDIDAQAEYPALGYEREVLTEGGVKPAAGATCKLGEPIEMRGHVLMSISLAEKQRADEDGWAAADRIDEKILDKRGNIRDTMRGLHGGYVQMEHDVRPLERL